MKPDLEFRLTTKITFADAHFVVVGEKVAATITKWLDTPLTNTVGEVEYDLTTVLASETRLLSEILCLPSYPRYCEFMSAYIFLTETRTISTGARARRKPRKEYAAYDRLTSMGKPIIPALYGDGGESMKQLGLIADAYNTKMLNSKAGKGKGKAKTDKKLYAPPWAKHAAFLKHDVSFTYSDVDPDILTIHIVDKIKVYRFLLGEYSGALPLPGSFGESLDTEKAILISRRGTGHNLARSKEVWSALQTLNVIVRNDKKQIVLLQGESGSGKEIFGQAIHCGSLRAKVTKLQQLSVAGISRLALQQTLFGSVAPKGGLVDGLIAVSEGATLFLDEFDKASIDTERPDFVSALLRVLESDDYYPVDSREPRRVQDVNWILAGAFSFLGKTDPKSKKAKEKFPSDLWSRFTDRLWIQNPVAKIGYPRAMFIYWHFLETVRWLRKEKTVLTNLSNANTVSAAVARLLLWGKQATPSGHNPDGPLKPSLAILGLAAKFEAKLGRPRGKYGARTIRQASTAASRELRARLIAKLGRTKGMQRIDVEDIKAAMEHAGNVLKMMEIEE